MATSRINKIAVIGTGVIGTGWVIRMLAHNKKVAAFDLNIKQKELLIKEIKRAVPFVKKLFNKKLINLNNLSFKTSLIDTINDVDFTYDFPNILIIVFLYIRDMSYIFPTGVA